MQRGGFLAIETPTGNDLLLCLARLIGIQSARQQSYIEDNYIFEGDVAPDVASAHSARYDARLSTVQDIATKAGNGGPEDVMAELIIVSNTEYFLQEPLETDVQVNRDLVDDDMNIGGTEQEGIRVERTPYVCGILADEAADWLNGIDERHQKTKALSRQLATKAGAESLNELMDASETFTLVGPIYHTYWDHSLGWRQNSVKHTFRSWGVHNMKTNKDYYYIQQEILIRMGPSKSSNGSEIKIYFPREEDTWITATNYGNYNRWYGSFFSRFITSMDLSGNGTINLEEAMPYTDNSTGYKTVNIGSEQSTTETLGISWSETIGIDPGVSFGGEYSLGTTNGTYFEVSTTHVDNDISVSKNTDGTKVTWTYTGAKPSFREVDTGGSIYYQHTTAPKALVNDIDLDNQMVWSVSNPSGPYTVNVTSHPYVAALLYYFYPGDYKGTPNHAYYETYTYEKNKFSHTLLEPFRTTQTWRMYVSIDEMKNGGPAGEAASKVESRLRSKFSCFRDEFTLCDHTATSVQVINANILAAKEIFKNNLDILQQFADEQDVKRYTIHWRTDNSKIRLREGFTVESDSEF